MRLLINVCLIGGFFALAACGPQPPERPKTESTESAQAKKPATSHSIDANDKMRFSKTLIEVPAGEKITITLNNVGHMPKQQMGHNLVILERDRKPGAFMSEATFAKDNEYIPSKYADWMIAHTKLLGPGESDTITFTAPKVPGDYDFLCSFPGHYAVGMKGIMRVVVEE